MDYETSNNPANALFPLPQSLAMSKLVDGMIVSRIHGSKGAFIRLTGMELFARIYNLTTFLTRSLISPDCGRLFNPSVQLMVQTMAPYFTERKKPAVRPSLPAPVAWPD